MQEAKKIFQKSKTDFCIVVILYSQTHTSSSCKMNCKKTLSRIQLQKNTKTHRLADIERTDPKTFWREIKEYVSKPGDGGVGCVGAG